MVVASHERPSRIFIISQDARHSPCKRFILLEGEQRRTCDADERPIRFQDCVGFHENRALLKTQRAVFLQKRPSWATYGRQGFLDPHKHPCYLTGWGTSTNYRCLYPSQSNNMDVYVDLESVDAREWLIWIICGECAECARFPLPEPTRTFNRTSRFESFWALSGVRRKVTGFSWDLVMGVYRRIILVRSMLSPSHFV
jgi:hypothetical protein